MILRYLFMLALISPLMFFAQDPAKRPKSLAEEPPNKLTMQVLMAQCPKGITEAQWKDMLLVPTTPVLFPIRVTRALLDTLDGRELDLRWQYVFVRE